MKSVNILADSRMPNEAKMELEKTGNVLWIQEEQKVYSAISCHPDIYFCQVHQTMIAAKNAPQNIVETMMKNGCNIELGHLNIGHQYPETARYNSVVTNDLIIRNLKIENSDLEKFYDQREIIHVAQGYTRCNLIHLKDNAFLTSDRGIEKELKKRGMDILWVQPEEIILPSVNHGFIGGCCGVFNNTLFLIGSLNFHQQKEEIHSFITKYNMKIKELYQGALWDGGGIFFVEY
ncbi:MAG: hypothetical protein PHR53_03870 [Bacteroidales bacterium]|nr:hypothetical protein [Bacteroidales bacterium]